MTEPRTQGYVDVNGVHMYYEVYGEGSPLVLLHGGIMTIDLNFASLIPALAPGTRSSPSRCRGTAAPPTPAGRSLRPRSPRTSSGCSTTSASTARTCSATAWAARSRSSSR